MKRAMDLRLHKRLSEGSCKKSEGQKPDKMDSGKAHPGRRSIHLQKKLECAEGSQKATHL